MRNVHDDAPVLMKTRWALSYLRGPLTGPGDRARHGVRARPLRVTDRGSATAARRLGTGGHGAARARRSAPASANTSCSRTKGTGPVLYKPMIAGFAKLHYVDAKLALDDWQTSGWLAPLDDGGGNASWEDAARDAALKSRLTQRARARCRIRRTAGPGAARRELLRLGERTCRRTCTRRRARSAVRLRRVQDRVEARRSRRRFPRTADAGGAREARRRGRRAAQASGRPSCCSCRTRSAAPRIGASARRASSSQQTHADRGHHRQLDPRRAARPQGDLRHQHRSRRHRRALRHALGSRIAGRDARGGKPRGAAAASRGYEARGRRRSRAARELRSTPPRVTLRAGRRAGAQIRHRRRRSGAGVGAVAQGRRWFPAPAYD